MCCNSQRRRFPEQHCLHEAAESVAPLEVNRRTAILPLGQTLPSEDTTFTLSEVVRGVRSISLGL